MISIEPFVKMEHVEDLGLQLDDDSYMGQPGWLCTTADGGKLFAYDLFRNGTLMFIVPEGRHEYECSTVEEVRDRLVEVGRNLGYFEAA
jgi:hypothetical protein